MLFILFQKSKVVTYFNTLYFIWIVLTCEMQWCHQWCPLYHMMLMPMASNDHICHVTCNFNCLDLRNAMLPLMTWHHLTLKSVSMASHDQNPDGQTSHVANYFNHLNLRNSVVLLTMPLASCYTNASNNDITWPENSCSTSFLSSWPKEWIGATDKSH